MTDTLVVLSGMAALLLILAFRKGLHVEGLRGGFRMFLNILPLLLLAFILVGYLNLLLPKEVLQSWLGEEAGWKGLFIGPAIGALVQGGPFAFFPLFDSVFRDSVTTGTAVAMITAWGMINVGHLPYEAAFLGPRFIMLKYSIYILFPTVAGFLANLIFGP
ncbi:MAG: hypothetical protein D5S00_07020 [Tindallia sp. MSAO_Bac2]|nr:MAG: hypothetical protein D5S00_07020 [Tindallia sp. MSAO_Bac2]